MVVWQLGAISSQSLRGLYFLQVLIPSIGYAGHQPISPVLKGRIPIKAHTGPLKMPAQDNSAKPATILMMRSIPPLFDFIVIAP